MDLELFLKNHHEKHDALDLIKELETILKNDDLINDFLLEEIFDKIKLKIGNDAPLHYANSTLNGLHDLFNIKNQDVKISVLKKIIERYHSRYIEHKYRRLGKLKETLEFD